MDMLVANQSDDRADCQNRNVADNFCFGAGDKQKDNRYSGKKDRKNREELQNTVADVELGSIPQFGHFLGQLQGSYSNDTTDAGGQNNGTVGNRVQIQTKQDGDDTHQEEDQ